MRSGINFLRITGNEQHNMGGVRRRSKKKKEEHQEDPSIST
jgi:hypothetical protein